jgi:hypothetical protein
VSQPYTDGASHLRSGNVIVQQCVWKTGQVRSDVNHVLENWRQVPSTILCAFGKQALADIMQWPGVAQDAIAQGIVAAATSDTSQLLAFDKYTKVFREASIVPADIAAACCDKAVELFVEAREAKSEWLERYETCVAIVFTNLLWRPDTIEIASQRYSACSSIKTCVDKHWIECTPVMLGIIPCMLQDTVPDDACRAFLSLFCTHSSCTGHQDNRMPIRHGQLCQFLPRPGAPRGGMGSHTRLLPCNQGLEPCEQHGTRL